jgi:sulfur carrier protein ThiS
MEVTVKITIILRKKEFILDKETTVRRALEMLEVPAESHLAVRDGRLLTEDERLLDGDVIQLISVISGG